MPKKNTFPFDEIAIERFDNYPDRPTLVFLHDSLGCTALWRDFPQKLGNLTKCNVLVYDRQGYGKSCSFSYSKRGNYYMEQEADVLNVLLDHWKIDKAILFGHSDGGSIALIAAAKYPQKIMSIITEGAHIFVEDLTVKGIKEAIHAYQTTNLKTKLEKHHGNKTDEMFWAWASTWTTSEFRSWNIESFLPSIQCPALIIQGEADEYGTLKQVQNTIRQVQKAEKYCIPSVGHSPHKECPEIVLEKASEFINQLTEI
ncbi:alpha/beta fold hydrolase [Flavobacterium cellulosilyticum]|uniref:Alpha/beta hydrolase n=1 Tax=Flavobacterium cellulosilyticum TaxID=2541731 RepID=A0A4R5CLZ3_9FLAO|nr:alpha/beta hydrolase [Flavobacterium cellulosilyticum]TDD99423.1 alpha/beta hydrolase [Flavobacterium cellulosilyticum]